MHNGQPFGRDDKMPWYIATIESWDQSGDTECTGTIIDDSWILTAAHCGVGKNHRVRLHVHSGARDSQTYRIAEVKAYPGIDHYGNVNKSKMDLALVRLDNPIRIGQFRKARLTSIPDAKGVHGWVAGGGNPARGGAIEWARAKIDEHNVQTNTLLLSVWPQKGDSGGPFMRWIDGGMELVGVWSSANIYGSNSTMTFVGGIAARTWITQLISATVATP